MIRSAPHRDRVVHYAISRVIMPRFVHKILTISMPSGPFQAPMRGYADVG